MPIVHFHLPERLAGREQVEAVAAKATAIYAEVLDSPVERIRVYTHILPDYCVSVGGKTLNAGAPPAPFFEFFVLKGRSLEQRHRVSAGFTEMLSLTLGCDASIIRGVCNEVEPDNWSIAGKPASAVRQGEIASRAGTH